MYLGWAILDMVEEARNGEPPINPDAQELVAVVLARALQGMARM